VISVVSSPKDKFLDRCGFCKRDHRGKVSFGVVHCVDFLRCAEFSGGAGEHLEGGGDVEDPLGVAAGLANFDLFGGCDAHNVEPFGLRGHFEEDALGDDGLYRAYAVGQDIPTEIKPMCHCKINLNLKATKPREAVSPLTFA
jgi:hypothetical protein